MMMNNDLALFEFRGKKKGKKLNEAIKCDNIIVLDTFSTQTLFWDIKSILKDV